MPITFRPDPFDRRTKREYAVVIFLPPELESVIAPIRERYDTDYNVILSHISIVYHFETSLSLDVLSSILRDVTADVLPVSIELSSIGDFYPQNPIIYWEVKSHATLSKMYYNLYSRLDLAVPHRKFVPHVTIAREISTHRVMLVKENIVPYLPDEQFLATAVDLVAPVADCSWVSVRTFPLLSSPK